MSRRFLTFAVLAIAAGAIAVYHVRIRLNQRAAIRTISVIDDVIPAIEFSADMKRML